MKFGYRYVQIGRLELFYSLQFSFGILKSSCGCLIFNLGFVGFTILSKECAYDL